MGSYCLTSHELRRFFEIELESRNYFDDEVELHNIFENWHSWEIELVFLATTLSQHLERVIKTGNDAQSILQNISTLLDETWLTLEGFDDAFVTYMLNQTRQDNTTMEDELIRVRQLQSEHHY